MDLKTKRESETSNKRNILLDNHFESKNRLIVLLSIEDDCAFAVPVKEMASAPIIEIAIRSIRPRADVQTASIKIFDFCLLFNKLRFCKAVGRHIP